MTRYFVYDVFTKVAFGGNQLAVIPDAAPLPEAQLQMIAREFNFSETVFLFPPADANNTAKVRIFTPTMEIPFAGHPTIGTAVALHEEGHTGAMVLELGVGPVACGITGDEASFTVSAPLMRFAEPAPALIASALGLGENAVNLATHVPVQASVGLPFVIVELHSKDDLTACQPAIDKFRQGATLHPTDMDFAIFAYVRRDTQIDARMFAPLDNIPEDPATGSASAALAALLTDVLKRDLELDILQGEAMGRPSYITAHTKHGAPHAVTITGHAVRTMQGSLLV